MSVEDSKDRLAIMGVMIQGLIRDVQTSEEDPVLKPEDALLVILNPTRDQRQVGIGDRLHRPAAKTARKVVDIHVPIRDPILGRHAATSLTGRGLSPCQFLRLQ